MTSTSHHAPGPAGPAERAPDPPAPAIQAAIRPADRTPWRKPLPSRPAGYSLACGLVAVTAGSVAALLSAGLARMALVTAVTAAVAVTAGPGYRLPRPARYPRPLARTAHPAGRSSH